LITLSSAPLYSYGGVNGEARKQNLQSKVLTAMTVKKEISELEENLQRTSRVFSASMRRPEQGIDQKECR
jgi:hypothetical protein